MRLKPEFRYPIDRAKFREKVAPDGVEVTNQRRGVARPEMSAGDEVEEERQPAGAAFAGGDLQAAGSHGLRGGLPISNYDLLGACHLCSLRVGRRNRRDPAPRVLATLPLPRRHHQRHVDDPEPPGPGSAPCCTPSSTERSRNQLGAQHNRTLDALTEKVPKVAAHLNTACADLLAFTSYPKQWNRSW